VTYVIVNRHRAGQNCRVDQRVTFISWSVARNTEHLTTFLTKTTTRGARHSQHKNLLLYNNSDCIAACINNRSPINIAYGARIQLHTQHHNASRNNALARPPGLHLLRSRSLTQHFHIFAQGSAQSAHPNREPAHGLVSSGLVLSHGCHRYASSWRIAFTTSYNRKLTRNRHHPNHASRVRTSTRIRTQDQPIPHEPEPEARSTCTR
jgi:hypothetical protein